ncbi:MAG TPA: hypothetical protein VHT29_04750 [Solirubrobacteraceae bacterium]|jgi:hypothetical protein|nr:hypothetical protein [Solirubrobacteraceae bacterium]
MRRVKVAVVAGLLIGVAALALALSRSPVTTAGASTSKDQFLGLTRVRTEACQAGEALPRDVTAVRLIVQAFTGPRVAVEVRSQGRVITRGERGSGWTANAVTVPVKPLSVATSGATLCFALYLNGYETVYLTGVRTSAARAATGPSGVFPGRVRVEYLRSNGPPWWSLAGQLARRMGLGRAGSGTWVVGLVIALMAGVVLLCSRMALRDLG